MPHEIARSLIQYFFPRLERQITRNLTFQRTATIQRPTGAGFALNRTGTAASGRSYTGTINPAGMSGGPVPVPYISFDAVVGRNSRFQDLTSEQMEELGGVEYRALKVLLWIVPCVSGYLPVTCDHPLSRIADHLLSDYFSTFCSCRSRAGSSSGPTSTPKDGTTTSLSPSLGSSPSGGLQRSRARPHSATRACRSSTRPWCPFKRPTS